VGVPMVSPATRAVPQIAARIRFNIFVDSFLLWWVVLGTFWL
jgi:hypothetical protein